MGDISVENAELVGLWFQLLATGACLNCDPPPNPFTRSSPATDGVYAARRVPDLLPAMHRRLPPELELERGQARLDLAPPRVLLSAIAVRPASPTPLSSCVAAPCTQTC